MNLKKCFELFVQGWLPKEPNLNVHQRKVSRKHWRPSRRLILPLIMGAVIGGLLGAIGSFLDFTSWLGPYVWPILIGITIGIISGAILGRKKLKEEQQKSAELKL
jgi:uncharacterized membrane protein YfcA